MHNYLPLRFDGIRLQPNAYANLDAFWGPYSSPEAAKSAIPSDLRKAGKKFGVVKTVGGETIVEEYMFTKDNATDNDVVKLVLSADDVAGTFQYSHQQTTYSELQSAIQAGKIITIGNHIASIDTTLEGYSLNYVDRTGVLYIYNVSNSGVKTATNFNLLQEFEYKYTGSSITTAAQLQEAVEKKKIIKVDGYVASVRIDVENENTIYIIGYTDNDGKRHVISHNASTEAKTIALKEFADVETIQSGTGTEYTVGGFKKIQNSLKLDIGDEETEGTLAKKIKDVIDTIQDEELPLAVGVTVNNSASDTSFRIKNYDNNAVGYISYEKNANDVYELHFVQKGQNGASDTEFVVTHPSIRFDQQSHYLEYSNGGSWERIINMSNLQVKLVLDDILDLVRVGGDYELVEDSTTTPYTYKQKYENNAEPFFALGDLFLVKVSGTGVTTHYDLYACSYYYDDPSIPAVGGTPPEYKWFYQFTSLGSINSPSLDAADVDYTPQDSTWNVLKVKQALDALRTSDGITMVGENKTLTQKMSEMPDNVQGSADSDLDIADENGRVLARFSEGHFKIKKFDSRDVEKIKQNTGLSEYDEFDEETAYDVDDVVLYNGILYKFTSAHAAGEWNLNDVEQTNIVANLNVEHPIDSESTSNADLDIADENDKVLARFAEGHIFTKNFRSDRILKYNLTDKKMCIIGDSYVKNHNQSETLTWHYLIAQEHGMTYVNYGINGNGLVASSSPAIGTPVVNRYSSMDDDADYVIVVGGKNDYNAQIPISDFKTGLATLCSGLINKYAIRGSKICFFTPWDDFDAVTDSSSIKLIEYVDAIIEVCGKYSIPVFDSSRKSSMFMFNSDFRTTYCQASNDISHLNANGHKLFKNKAFNFLNSL